MGIISRVLAGASAAVLASTGAMAADVNPVPVVVAPVVIPAAPTLAAYVELFGGYNRGFDTDEGQLDDTWRGFGFGGAGRAAWLVSPSFSLQLDAWAEHWSGRVRWFDGEECDPCEEGWSDTLMGVATHFTFATAGGARFGGMLSAGDGDFNTHVNMAAEVAFNALRVRVYGQAGYSIGFGDYAQQYAPRNVYGAAVVSFYPRDNVAISANLGVNHYREINDPGYQFVGVNFGARAELQLNGGPLSVFLAYQGEYRNWYVYGDIDVEHYVGVGISLLVGQPTIRDRDRVVGLSDLNPLFGATFRH